MTGPRRPSQGAALALLGGLTLARLLLVGGLECGRERRSEPLIFCTLLKQVYPIGGVAYERYGEVFDYGSLPQIPKFTLNDQQLELIQDNFNGVDAQYYDTFPFKVDTTWDLRVTHYWGEAHARVNMPADFLMTGPSPDYRFDPDSVLLITWQRSRGATSYLLDLVLTYDYLDWHRGSNSYEFERDTVLYDTFCVYAPKRFLTPEVQSVLAGDVDAVVYATDGPQTEPGAEGNVQGHGFGYYVAMNQPREAYFHVIAAPAAPLDLAAVANRNKARLVRRMRQAVGIPDSIPEPKVRP